MTAPPLVAGVGGDGERPGSVPKKFINMKKPKTRYSYVINSTQTGSRIDSFDDAYEAVEALKEYEREDKRYGLFAPSSYEIRVVNNETGDVSE